MEIVLSLWDSWDDDAIRNDRETGIFADPAKVRRLQHHGRWYDVEGTFTVPRTPQGRPVLLQAGQSGRGKTFAANWGELIFITQRSIEAARQNYREFKDTIASLGRNPDEVRVCPAIYSIIGSSEDEAADKKAQIEALAKPVDGLALLSEVLNYDFATKRMDEAFTDEELAGIKGLQGIRDRVVQGSGKKNPTVADFVEVSGRGTIRDFTGFHGTPKKIADDMTEWFETEACDGFVLAATHMPGAYEDFVRMVVPELQRRGVFRKEFNGTTLRENLALPRAKPFDWKRPV
jgi:FMN-dependent oxidoreductase (nitrilotriacetate monooxygenase family)